MLLVESADLLFLGSVEFLDFLLGPERKPVEVRIGLLGGDDLSFPDIDGVPLLFSQRIDDRDGIDEDPSVFLDDSDD